MILKFCTTARMELLFPEMRMPMGGAHLVEIAETQLWKH